MKQVIIKQGEVVVEDVPTQKVEAGTVLVQVHQSCISIGTELSGLKASGEPLWRKAIRYPATVEKAIELSDTNKSKGGRILGRRPSRHGWERAIACCL
jgi:hypothetical protein